MNKKNIQIKYKNEQKIWTNPSQNKIHELPTNILRDVHQSETGKKANLKHWEAITFPLE